jgi:hypothetical protein
MTYLLLPENADPEYYENRLAVLIACLGLFGLSSFMAPTFSHCFFWNSSNGSHFL